MHQSFASGAKVSEFQLQHQGVGLGSANHRLAVKWSPAPAEPKQHEDWYKQPNPGAGLRVGAGTRAQVDSGLELGRGSLFAAAAASLLRVLSPGRVYVVGGGRYLCGF